MIKRQKPQGKKGPLSLSQGRAEWQVIQFPPEKRPREAMIAEMFVRGANERVLFETIPYRPFTELIQNEENDVDFTVTTCHGSKLMELAEFAPLQKYGPKFKDAPLQIDQASKSECLLELIRSKSGRQGGPDHFLLLYVTEEAFTIDDITIEITRRALSRDPPNFERIYYLSPFNSEIGSVDEIFPGTPHYICGEWTDERLRSTRMTFMHPTKMSAGWEVFQKVRFPFYGECVAKFTYLVEMSVLVRQ